MFVYDIVCDADVKSAEVAWQETQARLSKGPSQEYYERLGWINLEASHRLGVLRRNREFEQHIEADDFSMLDDVRYTDLPIREAYRCRAIGPICERCVNELELPAPPSEALPTINSGETGGALTRFICAMGEQCVWANDSAEDAGVKQFRKLVEEQGALGKPFEDPDFPAEDSSIYMQDSVANFGVKGWARLQDIYRDNFEEMVQNVNGAKDEDSKAVDFQPDDVKQGSLSDCWFLSALTVIAQHYPAMLGATDEDGNKSGVFIEYDREVGACAIKFHKNFKWHTVIVDDRIPVNEDGEPAFAAARNASESKTGLWVPLIEKAYAKLHRSYEALAEGFVSDGLADLTQGIGDQYTMTDPVIQRQIEAGEFWERLMGWHRAKHLLGAGTPDAGSQADEKSRPVIDGIVQGHAYAILDVRAEGEEKLVKLRNPWANEVEWTGAWSDHSDLWTERMKKRLNFTEADDGEFWMSFDDFCSMFLYLFICRVEPSSECLHNLIPSFVGLHGPQLSLGEV